MQKKSELSFKGLPFRGVVLPLIKDDDPASKKPQLKYESYAKSFLLTKTEDVTELSTILSAAENSKLEIRQIERVYDAAEKTFCVYLHWSEPYYEMPEANGNA
jgi:hypothetical protein